MNFIEALLEGMPPAAAAVALAGLVNRASARLHTLARGQANAYKGQAEWPAWAQLQNAARALVLQASTCRDLTARLPADAAPESESGPGSVTPASDPP